MNYVKLFLLALVFLLAVSVMAAQRPGGKKYTPAERIPADTAVAFPVDI